MKKKKLREINEEKLKKMEKILEDLMVRETELKKLRLEAGVGKKELLSESERVKARIEEISVPPLKALKEEE